MTSASLPPWKSVTLRLSLRRLLSIVEESSLVAERIKLKNAPALANDVICFKKGALDQWLLTMHTYRQSTSGFESKRGSILVVLAVDLYLEADVVPAFPSRWWCSSRGRQLKPASFLIPSSNSSPILRKTGGLLSFATCKKQASPCPASLPHGYGNGES